MSNHLAVATVTATLRNLLQEAVSTDVTGANVTNVHPHDNANLPALGANLYLYQAVPNAALRNRDLPTRTAAGQTVQRPTVALDLHYLLSFYGTESQLEPQRVLGSAARALHARPLLTQDMIQATLDAARLEDPNHYLLASDLADDVERVKLQPMPLDLEALSKLWSVLLQTPYTLSMAYLASAVLIEAEETPRRPLPVRERVIGVSPFQRAHIDAIETEDGATEPIQMGDTIVLRGTQLAGAIAGIRVGVVGGLAPVANSVTPSEAKVALTDPALRAGVVGVQIAYDGGATSNVAALVLRPRVARDGGGNYRVTHDAGAGTIAVVLTPEVEPEQRVELFLNEFRPASGPGRAYRFDAEPATAATDTVTFTVGGVAAGRYLVRVQVSAAETVLDVETDQTSPDYGYYVAPSITLP